MDEIKDDVVTDDDLGTAFDSFLNGTENGPKVETEPPVEEPDKLGEKVEELFEKTNDLESKIATKDDLRNILDRLNEIKIDPPTIEEPEYDEYALSEEEQIRIDRYLSKRERDAAEKVKKEQTQYSNGYINTFKSLLDEVDNKDISAKIYEEMVKPGGECNKVLSGNPYEDCSKNFLRALKKVTKEINKTPFSRKVPDQPTGVTGSTSNSVSDKKPISLSQDAADLAERFNMSDDDIREALTGEIPLGLRGHSVR